MKIHEAALNKSVLIFLAVLFGHNLFAQKEKLEIVLLEDHKLIEYPTNESTTSFLIPLKIINHYKVPMFLPNLLITWGHGHLMIKHPCELNHPNESGTVLTFKKNNHLISDQFLYNGEEWYSDVKDTAIRYLKEYIQTYQSSILIGPSESLTVYLTIPYQSIANEYLELNEYNDHQFDLSLTYRSTVGNTTLSNKLLEVLRNKYHAQVFTGCINIGVVSISLLPSD